MEKTHKPHLGLTAQFARQLLLAALIALSVFCGLHLGVKAILDDYTSTAVYRDSSNRKALTRLQGYVTDNSVYATDWNALNRWVEDNPSVVIEVYRNHRLLYTSLFADVDQSKLWDESPEEAWDDQPYGWWKHYETVSFSDGKAYVFLECYNAYRLHTVALIGEIILCVALFLFLYLKWNKKLISYISVLCGDIQLMENGDFSHAVTIRGNDELTGLAENLDAMRMAFLQQRDKEKAYYEANQNLITQMSHDLRTPLTTLLLYTEILSCGKYENAEQMRDYLKRIDGKAHQIQRLADNIFQYSLASSDTEIGTVPYTDMEEAFFGELSETVSLLECEGFSIDADVEWPEGRICTNNYYVHRIMDNISSNILRYADPSYPVRIKIGSDNGLLRICFANTVRTDGCDTGNGVGLESVRAIMEKLNGECRVTEDETDFSVVLCFPIVL